MTSPASDIAPPLSAYRPAALLLAVMAAGTTLLIWLLPLRFDPAQLAAPGLRIGVMFACAMVLRRRRGQGPLVQRGILLLEGIVFLEAAWVVIRLLNHATMAVPFPLADDMLAGMDDAMRFDWRSWFDFVAARPVLRDLLGYSYTSLSLFSIMAFLLLALFADQRRCLCFVETFAATAVLCTVWGAFFPAMGTVDRFLGADGVLSSFAERPGDWFVAPLSALREGLPVSLQLDDLPGLVTFPSFHTASGILLIGIAWGSRLFVPVLAYSVLMIAATPIFGGHYFVDLIAGAVVAAILLQAYSRLPRYAGARPSTMKLLPEG